MSADAWRSQRHPTLLELELLAIVSHLICFLGTEFLLSAKAMHTLNLGPTSPVPNASLPYLEAYTLTTSVLGKTY